ncbi:MAG: DNA polymerase IV [Lachnospiraceae bacterium]|jgi:DNA polymerase-4
MDRIILHVDCNCFYASVEMLHHPELEGKAVAVGGDPEARHGIVLTANYKAKRSGVKTGMALWQAKEACPDVVFLPPRMDLYIRFSKMARSIYRDYSDKVESFGLDECWIDLTDTCHLFGDHTATLNNGFQIAEEISKRVKEELGITVSIGVSWNKIYAKLGSDYRKPDAITVFDRENYKGLIGPLPVSDLLYVGRRTRVKLNKFGIRTIGELAETDPRLLQKWFGKVGLMLSCFARGMDQTPVSEVGLEVPIKSIGNSTTTPRDLKDDEEVKLVLYLLAESVAVRLRENGFVGQVVEVYVRDSDLCGCDQQQKLPEPTNISSEIEAAAFSIFKRLYNWDRPIRSIGIRVDDLKPDTQPVQLSLFVDEAQRNKRLCADRMVEDLRKRFGFAVVQRGIMYQDRYLSSLDATADDHMIHPHSYMERGNRTGCEKVLQSG